MHTKLLHGVADTNRLVALKVPYLDNQALDDNQTCRLITGSRAPDCEGKSILTDSLFLSNRVRTYVRVRPTGSQAAF